MKFEIRSRASNQGKGFVCLEITVQDMAKSSSKIPFYLEDWIIFSLFFPLAFVISYVFLVFCPVFNIIGALFIFMGGVIVSLTFAHFCDVLLVISGACCFINIGPSFPQISVVFGNTFLALAIDSLGFVPFIPMEVVRVFGNPTFCTSLKRGC